MQNTVYEMCYCDLSFFFFKQKTAYEMRISDWSSDVCSSDLTGSVDIDGSRVTVTATLRRPLRILPGADRDVAATDSADAVPGLLDRKSVVKGKSVSVRVDPGGRRIIKKKTNDTIR